jgi:hypothetical protein
VEIEAATTAAFWCASPHLLRHNPMLPAASSNGKLPMNPVLSITQFLKPKKTGLYIKFTNRAVEQRDRPGTSSVVAVMDRWIGNAHGILSSYS